MPAQPRQGTLRSLALTRLNWRVLFRRVRRLFEGVKGRSEASLDSFKQTLS